MKRPKHPYPTDKQGANSHCPSIRRRLPQRSRHMVSRDERVRSLHVVPELF
jgi:hypothetical protein